MTLLYGLLCVLFVVFSYGFIDPNLSLSQNPLVQSCIAPLANLVYGHRPVAAGVFLVLLLALSVLFIRMLTKSYTFFPTIRSFIIWVLPYVVLLTFSYPMLSYDLFNYMTTAKVAYTHQENPYIVMPIEIANDPNLAFTRAANKVALYGPTWLLVTWPAHTLGMGNIWQTIIAFKLLSAGCYVLMCWLIWCGTKNIRNVIYFALNPLVVIEVLISGHNDIVMMVLAIGGFLLWQQKTIRKRLLGLGALLLSLFVKGATLVFLPFLFLRKVPFERMMFFISCLLFMVFIILAPIREELYPWYAVWFIATTAFLPFKKYSWVWGLVIALSLGLELRHVPYMVMGYYEGPGPLLRTLVTVLPVMVWGIVILYKRYTHIT